MLHRKILTLLFLFLHVAGHASFAKVYYAPLREEFVVVRSDLHPFFERVLNPLDVDVYIGKARRVIEQPVANRRTHSDYNLFVHLKSGITLLLQSSPHGIRSRYIYGNPKRVFDEDYLDSMPYEDLIELESDEHDFTHRLTLVELSDFTSGNARSARPTVESVLRCEERLSKVAGPRFM